MARDISYRDQTRFSRIGLAPETYGCFEFSDEYAHRFGYLTEIVEVAGDFLDFEFLENHKYLVEDLKRKYEEHEYEIWDAHPANLGWKGDKLVLLDFIT